MGGATVGRFAVGVGGAVVGRAAVGGDGGGGASAGEAIECKVVLYLVNLVYYMF